MINSLESFFLLIAVLLVLSIFASKLTDRYGIPALLVFIAIGMLAGSDGPGGIYFDDPVLAQNVGVVALVIILFSGGFDTEWRSTRPVLKEGIVLATLGVLLTGVILGLIAYFILGVTLLEGLLIGAITSSTDAAAVFGILQARNIRLRGSLKPLLQFESGSNDPMAVFLTVGVIQLIVNPGQSAASLIPMFFQQMIIGGLVGFVAGKLLLYLINRLKLGYEGLYPVLVFGMLLFTYGAAALVGGSGFLAVYILGLLLGKDEFIHKRSLMRFYNGLAWLMQIVMFLTLGLLVFPSQLLPVTLPGLALALALMLVARPVATFISMLFTRYSGREKLYISWVGLRGAVPIILATYPKLAGTERSDLIFNVVFFVVLTSVLFQGTTVIPAARLLKLDLPMKRKTTLTLEGLPDSDWKGALREIHLAPDSWAVGKAIYQLGLPMEYVIVLVGRGDEYLIPNGSFVLDGDDRIYGVSEPETHRQVEAMLENPLLAQHSDRMPG